MNWDDIRRAYPDRWVILEVRESHKSEGVIVPDRLAIVEPCPSASVVMERYAQLHAKLPGRFLCFAHTDREVLAFEERFWAGVRLSPAA